MPVRGADTKISAVITEEQDKPLNDTLAAKLAWVMERAGYVQKRGWNDFHKYHYVTEGDLVAAVRPLLAQMGIIIIPSVVKSKRIDEIQERSGTSTLTHVDVEYTVTDGKESFKFFMPGEGADRGDKGIYKAITGSMKYALYKLFEIETGDDPERDSPGESAPDVVISQSDESAEKGGRSKVATKYQIQRISATMREKGIDRSQLLQVISDELGIDLQLPEDDTEQGKTILKFLQELSNQDAGALVHALDEWKGNDEGGAS